MSTILIKDSKKDFFEVETTSEAKKVISELEKTSALSSTEEKLRVLREIRNNRIKVEKIISTSRDERNER